MGEHVSTTEPVRRRMLDEHLELRAAMARVTAAEDAAHLAVAAEALLERLSAHLDGEAEIAATDDGAQRDERDGRDGLREELATAPEGGLDLAVRRFVDALIADVYLDG
jgi:hypothetical protein